MITDLSISAARTLFACCSLNYLNEYRKAANYGEEDICDRNLWIYMLWAKGIMSRTPLMTEINGSIVVADAGTTAINGTYYPSGTNAEGIVYTLTTDPYTYIHLGGGVWNLMYNDSPYYYQSSVGVAATPADATWSANFGASPVPTFTLLEVSGKCVSREFAEQVFDKAKCFCEVCGCTPATPVTPVDCTITPDFTVDTVIDSAQVAETEANNQVDGFAYYIVSIIGGSGSTPGTMATYSTTLGGWQYTNPAAGSIILDSSSNVLWVDYVYPVLPAMLFPPIDVNSDESGLYVLQSRFPQQATGSPRSVVVEMSTDNTNWDIVYSGPENPLAIPTDVTVAETGYFFVRTTYVVGSCTYQYYDGNVTLLPNPPGSSRSWFTQGYTASPSLDFLDCLNEQQATVSFRFKIPASGDTISLDFLNGGYYELFFVAGDGGPAFPGLGNTLYLYAPVTAGNGQFCYAAPASIFALDTWHVATLVRDSATPDGWVPNVDFKVYLDGVQVLLTPSPVVADDPASWGPSDPQMGAQQVLVYSEAPTAGAYIDEIYGCRTARSAADVANIIVPNLMQGSDATWDRAFYWRVEDTDQDQLIACIPSGPPLIGSTNVLSTDVDPSI